MTRGYSVEVEEVGHNIGAFLVIDECDCWCFGANTVPCVKNNGEDMGLCEFKCTFHSSLCVLGVIQ